VLKAAPQFLSSAEGGSTVARPSRRESLGFSACQGLWKIAGRSPSRVGVWSWNPKKHQPFFFPESLDACWVLFQTFLIDSCSPISRDEFLADGLQVLAPISGHSGCPTTTITNSSDIGNHAFGWIISCWARFYKSRVLGGG
jgi:hypothetical protein